MKNPKPRPLKVNELLPDPPPGVVDTASLQAWDAAEVVKEKPTFEQMDALVADYARQDRQCKEIEELAKAASVAKEELKARVIGALRLLKRKSYKLEGIGTVTDVENFVVKCPDSITSKIAMFNWIKAKYGANTLMGMTSIHHQTLNSWYNKEAASIAEKNKLAIARGDKPEVLDVPGLDAPTSYDKLSFRKDANTKKGN